jgi:mono/diheme cytochrome c family protein
MKRAILLALLLGGILAACRAPTEETPTDDSSSGEMGMGMGMGQMRGMSTGMMERHHATVPEGYAGVAAPPASPEAIERGAELYAIHCMTCHGGGGMGDGPGGAALDPAPAPVAHTSQRMPDAYLYWRISEGGALFDTAMPAWKDTLDEQARWDVIHYLRALGRGEAEPASDVGQTDDPGFEAAQQAQMLANAVEGGVITQAEADLFREVHAGLHAYLDEHAAELAPLSMQERQAAALDALVETGELTQTQVDAFNDIHTRLEE